MAAYRQHQARGNASQDRRPAQRPIGPAPDNILQTAVQYLSARDARGIVSLQCSLPAKVALLRFASARALPVRFLDGRGTLSRNEDPQYNRVGVFVNASCPGTARRLLDDSRSHRFNSSFAWFIADPLGLLLDGNSDGLLTLADRLNLAVDSWVALASPLLPDVLEVYKVFYHLPLRVVPLRDISSPDARSQRNNLTGLSIRAVGESIRGSGSGWNQFSGYLSGFIRDDDPDDILKQGPRLFDLARALFNFTFSMYTVPGGAGEPLLNNTSCGKGIPGLLGRREFDFALQLWLDEARLKCVQFVAYNLVSFEPTLVHRMPTRSSSAIDSQVTPFSGGSWGGVFLMFGMMALLLLIADEFQLEEAFGNLGPWSAALIFGTAGISWGSIHYGINSTHLISVELGTVLGGLTYTVIFTYYQSSVVFGLLAKDSRPPLTPQEVLEKEYKVVATNPAFFVNLFEASADPALAEIRRRLLATEAEPVEAAAGGPDLGRAVRMVRDEHAALLGDAVAVAKQLGPAMTTQQLCSVRYSRIDGDSGQRAQRAMLYSAARPHWPPADTIKRGLILALERGLSRRIVRPFRMPCSGDGSTSSTTTISAFTVAAATSAFSVLLLGLVLVSFICALETVGPRMERAWERFLRSRRASALLELFERDHDRASRASILFERRNIDERRDTRMPAPSPLVVTEFLH